MAKTNQKYITRVEEYLQEKTDRNKPVVFSTIQKALNMRADALKETLAILQRFNKVEVVSNGKFTLIWVEKLKGVELSKE